jgi:DNA-binding NarL/FixJ family response regulator
MLAAVRRAFADVEDFEIVGEVSVGTQVVSAVRETKPDVVLLDLRMPELDGLACLERLRKHDPGIAVVILSSYSDEAQIEAARRAGALGYVVKTVEPVDLADVVRKALSGQPFAVWGQKPPLAASPDAGTTPQRARSRRSRSGCPRAVEHGDRPPAVDQRADRQVPSAQHLPKA